MKKRGARAVAAATSIKELTVTRWFLKFYRARKWIAENPATNLKGPKADSPPTMPFTDEEVDRILDACNRVGNPNNQAELERSRRRARALVLVLLYSGFRISDAVQLRRTAVDMKTGQVEGADYKDGRAALYPPASGGSRRSAGGADRVTDLFFLEGNIEACDRYQQREENHAGRFRAYRNRGRPCPPFSGYVLGGAAQQWRRASDGSTPARAQIHPYHRNSLRAVRGLDAADAR